MSINFGIRTIPKYQIHPNGLEIYKKYIEMIKLLGHFHSFQRQVYLLFFNILFSKKQVGWIQIVGARAP